MDNRSADRTPGELKLALKAARRADDLTHGENPAILDTLAKVYFDSGDPARALELQQKAVKIVGQEDRAKAGRLEQYRKAVEKLDAGKGVQAEEEKKP